jgi:hypothetical protein
MSTEPVQTIDPTPVVETQEAAPVEVATPEVQPVQEDKKPNRTGEFIDRLKGENREYRQKLSDYERRMAALEARLPKEPEVTAPDPNSFYNDPLAYVNQTSQYSVHQARQQWEQEQAQRQQQEESERVAASFREKSQAFAAEHPDFEEVIYSVPEPLLPEDLARTIIAHERGPELAYHLGTNLGELAVLASVAPHLRQYRLNELVSRLDGESRTTAPPPEAPNPVAVPVQPQKPISQAPAPAPRVGGRTPTEVPPEKMTDDEWYKQDMERRRKR